MANPMPPDARGSAFSVRAADPCRRRYLGLLVTRGPNRAFRQLMTVGHFLGTMSGYREPGRRPPARDVSLGSRDPHAHRPHQHAQPRRTARAHLPLSQ